MLSEAEIRLALRDCYDPELPCNIVDLGLVERIAVTLDREAPGAGVAGVAAKFRIQLTLLPVHPDESLEAQITAQIANRLAGLEPVSGTLVEFLHNPPWTPLRISPAGRRFLGLDGNPSLVQIRA